MKIKIVGAAGGEVTGSAYYVQTEQAKILVDAGMFQGGKKSETKNRLPFTFTSIVRWRLRPARRW
jgi:metallo-beta-lactamase family protein